MNEIVRIVRRLNKIDSLYRAEVEKEEAIDRNPKYLDGFFSGYEASPTNRCKQLKKGIGTRVKQLSSEQMTLFSKITMQQAVDHGYCVDGMDEEDFLTSSPLLRREYPGL